MPDKVEVVSASLSEPTKIAAELMPLVAAIKAAYTETPTSAMLAMLNATGDTLQAEIMKITTEGTDATHLASKELQDIGIAILLLHKTLHKFPRGEKESVEFETYAKANRAYKSWKAKFLVIEESIKALPLEKRLPEERRVIDPLRMMDLNILRYVSSSTA